MINFAKASYDAGIGYLIKRKLYPSVKCWGAKLAGQPFLEVTDK